MVGALSVVPRRRFYWRLSNGGRAFYGILAGQLHGGFPRVQNVAMADLIPWLHRRMELTATLRPIALIMGGVLTIYIADSILH